MDVGPAGGEGVPLLHGFPRTARAWDTAVPVDLGAGYRLLVSARRGCSPGARPAGRHGCALRLSLPLSLCPSERPVPVRIPTLCVWSDGDRSVGRAVAESCRRFVDTPSELVALCGALHRTPRAAARRGGPAFLAHAAAHRN